MTSELELADIQGLVVRGYGSLEAARFLLLAIDPAHVELARGYVRTLCERVNRAKHSPERDAIQVAFTATGLKKLGVPKAALATFSREFLEGMHDDVRAESLGDRGANDPSAWQWGRGDVDMLLMLYAHDDGVLVDLLRDEQHALEAAKLRVVRDQATITLAGQKEHFGWRDGLSMPVIEGVKREGPRRPRRSQEWWTTAIKPGEFVLGYKNEYDCFTESPVVDPVDDEYDHLLDTSDGRKDLGKNGTYLVYREMSQDVPALWQYLARVSRERTGEDAATNAIALGAKMVGRWPDGAPLERSPHRDDPDHATDNAFRYEHDPLGLKCPIGAHVRRANPRDQLGSGRDAEDSVVMVRRHQMIRRGRAFGAPIAPSMEARDIMTACSTDTPNAKPERGLHFICLVGHISRQFEFVQRAWIHSANFGGLYRDGDPISAARRQSPTDNPNDEFTCPATPVRRKYTAMPQFTTLVGGSYFFLPSIRVLRYLARQP